MGFDPQKFFIGITDFFAVLMPGALLTFCLLLWFPDELGVVVAQADLETGKGSAIIIFLFMAYVLGHFIFLIGSLILDNFLYDPLRNCNYWGVVRRLAAGKKLPRPLFRKLAESVVFFGKGADNAVMKAQQLKARALAGMEAGSAINAYQWSKLYLSKQLPSALVEVQRLEAHSKFFRSFTVVLPLIAGLSLWRAEQYQYTFASLAVATMLFAFWRYSNERYKATRQAYQSVITLEGMDIKTPTQLSARGSGPTHGGGVIFRETFGRVEYMLVRSSDGSEWVLPKGHIEAGESPAQTAVREIKEETGCWARVVAALDTVPLYGNRIAFFLMEFLEPAAAGEKFEERETIWLSLEEARNRSSFDETKVLLQKAENVRSSLKRQMNLLSSA